MRAILALALLLLTPPALSDLDKAHAETHQLRVSLLGCQEQLVAAQVAAQKASLTEQQAALEAKFRELLKPPEGSTWNWQTLVFDPKPAPAPTKEPQ
jgi:hypothetical protein